MNTKFIYFKGIGLFEVGEMEFEKVWENVSRLGSAEIVRRTAEAAGCSQRVVARAMTKKVKKLFIVTDAYAAFLVAYEMGVAERITDEWQEPNEARPECGAAADNLRASLGSVDDARARIVVARDRKEKRGNEDGR